MGRTGGIRPVSPFLRAALCLGHEVKVEVISAIPDTGDGQRVISIRRFFFLLQEVNRLDRIDFSHRMPFLVVGCHFVAAYETVGRIGLQALYRAVDGIYLTVIGDKLRAVAFRVRIDFNEFSQKRGIYISVFLIVTACRAAQATYKKQTGCPPFRQEPEKRKVFSYLYS